MRVRIQLGVASRFEKRDGLIAFGFAASAALALLLGAAEWDELKRRLRRQAA